MTQNEINEVLKKHKMWLNNEKVGERACLSRANLYGANLSRANLSGANLSGAIISAFQLCPEGDIIVYKKLKDNVIAQLLIPKEAKRTSSLVGRKCRAEYAKVISFCGTGEEKAYVSKHDGETVYAIGEMVRPDKYDDDVRVECTSGIHFFITKAEAEKY